MASTKMQVLGSNVKCEPLFTQSEPAQRILPRSKSKLLTENEQDQVSLLCQLLADQVFVDYFNVFLALPIFPDRLLYDFRRRHFICQDPLPYMTFTFMNINHNIVLEWIIKSRFPRFFESFMYYEYSLCQNLLHTKELLELNDTGIQLSSSNEQLKYDDMKSCIGHVQGMHKFRSYLNSGPGSLLIHLWMDLEKFRCIPLHCMGVRFRKVRELQAKYFMKNRMRLSEGLSLRLDVLLQDGKIILERTTLMREILQNPIIEIRQEIFEYPFISSKKEIQEFVLLQQLVLCVLHEHYLRNYIIRSHATADLKFRQSSSKSNQPNQSVSKSNPLNQSSTKFDQCASKANQLKKSSTEFNQSSSKSEDCRVKRPGRKPKISPMSAASVSKSGHHKSLSRSSSRHDKKLKETTTIPAYTSLINPTKFVTYAECPLSAVIQSLQKDIPKMSLLPMIPKLNLLPNLEMPGVKLNQRKSTGETQLQTKTASSKIPVPIKASGSTRQKILSFKTLMPQLRTMEVLQAIHNEMEKDQLFNCQKKNTACVLEDYLDIQHNKELSKGPVIKYQDFRWEARVLDSDYSRLKDPFQFFTLNSDRIAGYPFLKDMVKNLPAQHVYDACFYHGLTGYLCMNSYPFSLKAKHAMLQQSAQLLLAKYALKYSKPLLCTLNSKDVWQVTKSLIREDSPHYLIAAQDKISCCLADDVRKYLLKDYEEFLNGMKRGALECRSDSNLDSVSAQLARLSKSSPAVLQNGKTKDQTSVYIGIKPRRIRQEWQPHKQDLQITVGQNKNMVVKKFEYTSFASSKATWHRLTSGTMYAFSMCGYGEDLAPLVSLEDVEADEPIVNEKARFGSIDYVPKKPTITIRQREQTFIKEYLQEAMPYIPVTKKHLRDDEDEDESIDLEDSVDHRVVNILSRESSSALPYYMRQVKIHKKSFIRKKASPKFFEHVFLNPADAEFFRRYLRYMNDEYSLLYLFQVDMIQMLGVSQSASKLQELRKDFFSTQTFAEEVLGIQDAAIGLIVKDKDATFDIYLHIYDLVQKRLRTSTFHEYQKSFPDQQRFDSYYRDTVRQLKKMGKEVKGSMFDPKSVRKSEDKSDSGTTEDLKHQTKSIFHPRDHKEADPKEVGRQKIQSVMDMGRKRIVKMAQNIFHLPVPASRQATEQLLQAPPLQGKNKLSLPKSIRKHMSQGQGSGSVVDHLAEEHIEYEEDDESHHVAIEGKPSADRRESVYLSPDQSAQPFVTAQHESEPQTAAITHNEPRKPAVAEHPSVDHRLHEATKASKVSVNPEQHGMYMSLANTKKVQNLFTAATITALQVTMSKTAQDMKKLVTLPPMEAPVERNNTAVEAIMLWKKFIAAMVLFKRSLSCRPVREEFLKYLRFEARRISKKLPEHEWGTPLIKKVKGKVIDLMKLPQDTFFILECSIYSRACEMLNNLTNMGLSIVDDAMWVNDKATIITELFLLSEISPIIQINISKETAADIVLHYMYGGAAARHSLFHAAVMEVLPTIALMWNRFVEHRYGKGFANYQTKLREHLESLNEPVNMPPVVVKRKDVETVEMNNVDESKGIPTEYPHMTYCMSEKKTKMYIRKRKVEPPHSKGPSRYGKSPHAHHSDVEQSKKKSAHHHHEQKHQPAPVEQPPPPPLPPPMVHAPTHHVPKSKAITTGIFEAMEKPECAERIAIDVAYINLVLEHTEIAPVKSKTVKYLKHYLTKRKQEMLKLPQKKCFLYKMMDRKLSTKLCDVQEEYLRDSQLHLCKLKAKEDVSRVRARLLEEEEMHKPKLVVPKKEVPKKGQRKAKNLPLIPVESLLPPDSIPSLPRMADDVGYGKKDLVTFDNLPAKLPAKAARTRATDRSEQSSLSGDSFASSVTAPSEKRRYSKTDLAYRDMIQTKVNQNPDMVETQMQVRKRFKPSLRNMLQKGVSSHMKTLTKNAQSTGLQQLAEGPVANTTKKGANLRGGKYSVLPNIQNTNTNRKCLSSNRKCCSTITLQTIRRDIIPTVGVRELPVRKRRYMKYARTKTRFETFRFSLCDNIGKTPF